MPAVAEKRKSVSSAAEAGRAKPQKGSNSGKRAPSAVGSKNGAAAAAPNVLPETITYLGGKHRGARQRATYHSRLDELAKVICASSPAYRTLLEAESASSRPAANDTSASPAIASTTLRAADAFPVLSVGYLARALGLNVSNAQVAAIVELVEEDGPSAGFVDRRRLEKVLVDALMTGTVGGPTLREHAMAVTGGDTEANAGELSAERLARFSPFLCVRDSEETLLRAFQALDTENKGYLKEAQLREAVMLEGEAFSEEEADEMWMAMRDPQSNRVYYRDFADLLMEP